MTRGVRSLLWLALVALVAGSSPAEQRTRRGKLNPHTGRRVVTPGRERLSRDQLRALAARHGIRQVDVAVLIASRESGRFADVVVDTRGMSSRELREFWGKDAGPELSVGLWQINVLANGELVPGATHEEKAEALKSPEINAAVTARLSQGGTNWKAWGA